MKPLVARTDFFMSSAEKKLPRHLPKWNPEKYLDYTPISTYGKQDNEISCSCGKYSWNSLRCNTLVLSWFKSNVPDFDLNCVFLPLALLNRAWKKAKGGRRGAPLPSPFLAKTGNDKGTSITVMMASITTVAIVAIIRTDIVIGPSLGCYLY